MVGTAAIPSPKLAFPEDVERAITDALLHDVRDMCGTMSLVASRFHAWTKPHLFRIVVVRRHESWTKRVSELLLPNARFIRALALDLRLVRGALSDEEAAHVQQLLEAAEGVRHLAVPWSIWARHPRECGRLPLESLCLVWDGTHPAAPPSLAHLQHPAALTDLTVCAPPDLRNPTPFRAWGDLYLPDTARCANLAWVAYAADRPPVPTVGSLCADIPQLKGALFVLVDIPEKYVREAEEEDALLEEDRAVYPNFATAYLPRAAQVLGEWVAKMEGRRSVLDHPPPHEVECEAEDGE
ncbi:hypothetical protein FB451DRAFT_1239406 [Mycena latifolia]|nr:hypothetical protein FB451DRAFT_1239406 [Mycena latifolia]